MTRGKIIFINGEDVYCSTEFNGDMAPYHDMGSDVIEMLKSIETLEEYAQMLEDINKRYRYDEDLYERITKIRLGNFTRSRYYDRWFSDYIYILNLSDDDIKSVDYDGKEFVIPSGKTTILHFGKVYEHLVY